MRHSKTKKLLLTIISAFLWTGIQSYAADFKAGNSEFLLDGKPYLIKAAELHYPRIPKEYWENRILMCKALGMNTICLYSFWNAHEPTKDTFDFEGNNDIRRFIELCQQNDMNVILRPGPYVCAEWEMGGLPWWLLKDKDIELRSTDPRFLDRVKIFEEKLAEQISDLTVDKGGPIIMIQVENEYGAYGVNKDYISEIKHLLKDLYGEEVLMFQCDWSSNFTDNGLDDLLWTLNFGTGSDIDSQFKELKDLRPDTPLMCSEFWSGWFDKWGAPHETRSADEMIAGIDEMLAKNISFSLYMTHGGTNWGHWAGANSPGYSPDVTSYDYDAPINENGQPTPKFWLLKNVLDKYNEGHKINNLPELYPTMPVKEFSLDEYAGLWDNVPPAIYSDSIKTFEEINMGFGSAIYSTRLPNVSDGTLLRINEPHDFAQVFIDGVKIGDLDRRNGETEIILPQTTKGSKLDILVEGTGRINFGRAIKDFKGITEYVALVSANGEETKLTGWEIASLPDVLEFYNNWDFQTIDSLKRENISRMPPGVYRGEFELDTVADTFLNFENWGKGLVYVNGHGIGRIWEIGPQQTLYVPGPWLKEGKNSILIFDILGPTENTVEGLTEPILDKIRIKDDKINEEIDFLSYQPILTSSFEHSYGWKNVEFEKPFTGRYLGIEITSSHTPSDGIAVAEIYILDENGNRLSREGWTVTANSYDSKNGNHTPDKIIDLQESTYWQSSDSNQLPASIIIDLGEIEKISGMQYLPRGEAGVPGCIAKYKVYVSDENFVK